MIAILTGEALFYVVDVFLCFIPFGIACSIADRKRDKMKVKPNNRKQLFGISEQLLHK